jgi:hypothetical protein
MNEPVKPEYSKPRLIRLELTEEVLALFKSKVRTAEEPKAQRLTSSHAIRKKVA